MIENTRSEGAHAISAQDAEGSSSEAASGLASNSPDSTSLDQTTDPAVALKDRVIEVLKTVYDPEIPVDIYELGLIYGVEINETDEVLVTMTLTSPMCPVAETLPVEVETKVRGLEGVASVELSLVWDPPWDPDMISEAAKLELNF